MKEKMEPLDRLLRAAARAPQTPSDDPRFGWQTPILAAVREERARLANSSFAILWKRGVLCALAAAAAVISFSAWNMNVSSDPERVALEPSEIYLAIK